MEEILHDKLFVPICMQKEVYFDYSSFCVAVNELSMLTSFQAWIYFGFRPATVWRQVWQAWGLGGVRRPRFGCISRLLSLLWLLALSKLTPPRVYGQSSRKSKFVSRIWDIFQPSRRLLGALAGFYFRRVFVCLYVEQPRTFWEVIGIDDDEKTINTWDFKVENPKTWQCSNGEIFILWLAFR